MYACIEGIKSLHQSTINPVRNEQDRSRSLESIRTLQTGLTSAVEDTPCHIG